MYWQRLVTLPPPSAIHVIQEYQPSRAPSCVQARRILQPFLSARPGRAHVKFWRDKDIIKRHAFAQKFGTENYYRYEYLSQTDA
jgi:hypothetical protein